MSAAVSLASVWGFVHYVPLGLLENGSAKPHFGSTITTINGSDTLSSSRSVLNTNFANLNTDKVGVGDLAGTTSLKQLTTLATLATVGTITTGVWNATVIGSTYGGTGANLSASTGALSVSGGTFAAGTLAVGNGGTGSAAPTTNGILFYNGSIDTTSTRFNWNGTLTGVGTSSPFATLSLHANPTDATLQRVLFAIGSSTATATTTLVQVSNGGQLTGCETVYGNTANGATFASSTSMTVNFRNTCNEVLLQMGSAAFTVTVTGGIAGDTKRILIANPTGSAGAVTWAGIAWLGGATPSQTTTANSGDAYSCVVTQATSTAATSIKYECAQSSGLQ